MTVGALILTILLLVIIGNSLYVYLDSGVVFDFFGAKNVRQALTVIVNMIICAVVAVSLITFITLYWNVPL